ncbi:MAG: hypothetical protein KGM42_08840 [Hyphomicrobiales bacterium]|nr:hypothetical protein [Hyphomicrobiales bacterium]
MDQIVDRSASDESGANAANASAPLQPEIQDSGRNAVFAALVKGDSDVTGLVAYSIFKQNELDWLSEFRNARGREPGEAEADAYIIGESTPRRLATYRHLAEATLQGRGPDVASGGASSSSLPARAADRSASGGFAASTLLYVVLTIAVAAAVYFFARYGAPK